MTTNNKLLNLVNKNLMTKKASTIHNFPLEKFKNNWPFNSEISRDLFHVNSYRSYSSLKEFLEEEEYLSNEYFFNSIFIENDQTYYEDLSGKVYTLENIPYSFIVCSAIKYELNYFGTFINGLFHWSRVLHYLLFTPFPVLKILEEGSFIKTQKR